MSLRTSSRHPKPLVGGYFSDTFVPWAVSLWHKRADVATLWSISNQLEQSLDQWEWKTLESSCLVSPGVVFLASEDEVTAEYKRQNDGSEILLFSIFIKLMLTERWTLLLKYISSDLSYSLVKGCISPAFLPPLLRFTIPSLRHSEHMWKSWQNLRTRRRSALEFRRQKLSVYCLSVCLSVSVFCSVTSQKDYQKFFPLRGSDWLWLPDWLSVSLP